MQYYTSLQCDELSSSHNALEQELTSSKEECELLKKNLKRIMEIKSRMEWQRDDASRQLDDLEEKMEVGVVICVLALWCSLFYSSSAICIW